MVLGERVAIALPEKLHLKSVRVGLYEVTALLIIACSTIFRLLLSANNWPRTDSDEGTMGLAAIHIAFRGEHPIFFYGQHYMGVLEAYLGAFFFRVFGVSIFSLRLGMILLFTLFLMAMYVLVSLLYQKSLAIFTLVLLSFANASSIQSELLAVGGVVETLLFGTLALLIACWLAFTADGELRRRQGWRRAAAYGCWGLAVGLGVWSHVLVAPFVLLSGVILLLFCGHEWRSWALPSILLGLVVGGFPLIVYNLTTPLSQNSLAVALSIQSGVDPGSGVHVGTSGVAQHFVGTFFYGLPVATGVYPVCSLSVLPFYGPAGLHTVPCMVIQGGWSLVYMALLLISLVMALLPLRALVNQYRFHRETWSSEQRRLTVLHVARVMLILCGLLTILLFLHSTLAAAKPYSVRYLIGLLIVLPAVIWPLWSTVARFSTRASRIDVVAALRYGLFLVSAIVIVRTAVAIFPAIPPTRAYAAHDRQLVDDLEGRGITRFYTEYWTCDRLVFLSQEKLICSDVSTNLTTPALNRVASYTPQVEADPRAPYVVPVGPYTEAFDHNPKIVAHYHRFLLDGYVVYAPK